jgi:DNA-binding transcriptional ArsR family regulator
MSDQSCWPRSAGCSPGTGRTAIDAAVSADLRKGVDGSNHQWPKPQIRRQGHPERERLPKSLTRTVRSSQFLFISQDDYLIKLLYCHAMPGGPIYEVKAQLFKTLGHPARIRILEVLSDGPRSVSALQPDVGIESSHLSQQLAVLRRAGVVESDRDGSSVIYTIADPQILDLLAVAKEILTTALTGAQELLSDLDAMSYETTSTAS